jgi:hypothetical protein
MYSLSPNFGQIWVFHFVSGLGVAHLGGLNGLLQMDFHCRLVKIQLRLDSVLSLNIFGVGCLIKGNKYSPILYLNP